MFYAFLYAYHQQEGMKTYDKYIQLSSLVSDIAEN